MLNAQRPPPQPPLLLLSALLHALKRRPSAPKTSRQAYFPPDLTILELSLVRRSKKRRHLPVRHRHPRFVSISQLRHLHQNRNRHSKWPQTPACLHCPPLPNVVMPLRVLHLRDLVVLPVQKKNNLISLSQELQFRYQRHRAGRCFLLHDQL